jgi:DNA-binding MarR family transcriptional regulator
MHAYEREHMHLFGMAAMTKRISAAQPRQAAPVDPVICNCLAVRQAARQVTQLYDMHLAQVGLRTSQYSILAKLGRLGPLSINELAALMVMDRTTTGRAVRPLERDELVAIGPGQDGRTRVVRLTPAGAERLQAALQKWRQAQKQFEASYGAVAAADLRAALGRVVAAL